MTEAPDISASVATAIRLANASLEPLQNLTSTSKHGSNLPYALMETLDGLIKALTSFEDHFLAHAGNAARLSCLQQLSPVLEWCIAVLPAIDASNRSSPKTEATYGPQSERGLKGSSEILEAARHLMEAAIRADDQMVPEGDIEQIMQKQNKSADSFLKASTKLVSNAPVLDNALWKKQLLNSLQFEQMGIHEINITMSPPTISEWCLESTEYLEWSQPGAPDEHRGLLYIEGMPRTGKSRLMKFLVTNTRIVKSHDAVISYFFNQWGIELEKSAAGMYRTLLHQLFTQLPDLPELLDHPQLAEDLSDKEWTVNSLKSVLKTAVRRLGKSSLVCFIDGLDVHKKRRDLIAFFESLGVTAKSEGVRFQVCLSSRHSPPWSITRRICLDHDCRAGSEPQAIVTGPEYKDERPLLFVDTPANMAPLSGLAGADDDTTRQSRIPPNDDTSASLDPTRLVVERDDHNMTLVKDGIHPLHNAAYAGNLEIARFLLEEGTDIMAVDNGGRTPLHFASFFAHLDVTKLLLERGADIMAVDKSGQTPLHKATQSGKPGIVRLLLRMGANVTAVDNRGCSALHYASEDNQAESARALVKYGALPSGLDSQGRTPAQFASDPFAFQKLLGEISVGIAERVDDLVDNRNSLGTGSNGEVVYDDRGNDIESVISAVFSDTSTNSSSSLLSVDLHLATLELAAVLCEDQELHSLFKSANAKVGKERFIRNCRRLLNRFGYSLRGEATSDLQYQLASFVRRHAYQIGIELEERSMASNYRRKEDLGLLSVNSARVNGWIESQPFAKFEAAGAENKTLERLRAHGQDDNDSDICGSDIESVLSDVSSETSTDGRPSTALGAVKEFLTSSQALAALRRDLRHWIEACRETNQIKQEAVLNLENSENKGTYVSCLLASGSIE
ncbi:hypothetical protein PG984_000244 [Apiospora sp. TS-2023a]